MKKLEIMMSSIVRDYVHSTLPAWGKHGFEPLTLAPISEGERMIVVGIKDDATSKEIFRQICDARKLQEWLSCALLHIFDPPPACLDQSINLLKSIHQFYEAVPDKPDAKLEARIDEMYDFRMVHDIRFGFRGCDVPSVILGSKNGQTHIWYCRDGEYIEERVTIAP